MKKLTIEFCQQLAEKKNGFCLSDIYENCKKKLVWKCEHNHIWSAPIDHIINANCWCPYCSGKAKYTIEDVIKLAKCKGGKCLSTEYKNNHTKIWWECKSGHQWKSTLLSVNAGHWCPHCAGNARCTLENANILAETKGGKCLSTECKNNHTKMLWQCEEGHQWYTCYYTIKSGYWCPHCAGNARCTLDQATIFAQNLGGKCLSTEYTNSSTKMLWECRMGHQWKASFGSIKCGSWCPLCFGNTACTLQDATKLASSRGGKCLSTEYKNSKYKMLWQCKEGHQWKACFGSIRNNNSWCPMCGRLDAVKKMNISSTEYHWKNGKELVCQGSYEKKVVQYFNNNKVNFLWQPVAFEMPDGRTYRPDVFLCDSDMWVEIKGYFWNDAEEKWNWFHDQKPNSELWDEEKLKKMEIL